MSDRFNALELLNRETISFGQAKLFSDMVRRLLRKQGEIIPSLNVSSSISMEIRAQLEFLERTAVDISLEIIGDKERRDRGIGVNTLICWVDKDDNPPRERSFLAALRRIIDLLEEVVSADPRLKEYLVYRG